MSQLDDDIRTILAALARRALREWAEDVDRLRQDSWTVRLSGAAYVLRWSDGTLIASIDAETVALAVAMLRAKRDARTALVN